MAGYVPVKFPKPGSAGLPLIMAAVRDGEVITADSQQAIAAAKCLSHGYLTRDPQNGNRWFPTDKGRAMLEARNALAPVSPDAVRLVDSVGQARELFAAGDLVAARDLAQFAYSSAPAFAKMAEKLRLKEALEACQRIQADALEVVSYSEIHIATDWERLSAEGKTHRGRPKSVVVEDAFTALEVGLTRDQIHKAKKLRDAENAEPGFIRRTIEELVRNGVAPTKAGLRAAIGTKSASKAEKGVQLYETPIEAMRVLLALESFSATIKEPFVGKGAILKPLEEAGYDVLIADLEDRGITTQYGDKQQVGDFLLSDPQDTVGMDIVSNPPYDDLANACIAHALKMHKPRKMAMLLNWNFAAGFEDPNRRFAMDECPPSRVYVFTKRLPMMHRDGWDGPKASSQMNTAWFVWEQNEDGTYGAPGQGFATIRVFWPDFEFAEPARPGDGGHWTGSMAFREREEDFSRQTPKLTDAEKLDAVRGQALAWMQNCGWFNMDMLRRGVGIRPTTASALVAELVEQGALCNSGGGWRWAGEPRQGGGV